MKNNPVVQRVFAIVALIGILSSCSHYKLVSHMPENTKKTKEYIKVESKDYVVVHIGDQSWQLVDFTLKNGVVVGKLVETNAYQDGLYNNLIASSNDKYEPTDDYEYQDQIHLYLDETIDISNAKIAFNETNVIKVNAVQKSGNGWRIVRNILIVIGGLILGMGIFLAIVCNCPHAYTFDGDSYNFTNTLFTGATAKNLERYDYTILEDYSPSSTAYDIILKNDENESHYIDMLDLIIVEHDANVEILHSQEGQIFGVSSPISPIQVLDANNSNITSSFIEKDNLTYQFDNIEEKKMVNAYATFEKPEDVPNAKLILSVKNTQWGGIVYETFGSMLGNNYSNWVEKNHQRSQETALKEMKDAGVPLTISVKNNGKWVEMETINLVGEVNYKSLVVPLKKELLTESNIEVRLQAGFKFWEVDYLAMDYSIDSPYKTTAIKPTFVSSVSKNITSLNDVDGVYLEHLNTGDSTHVRFENIESQVKKRTLLLRSRGYYISKDNYTGRPYWSELVRINQPGGLSILSKEIYRQYFKSLAME